MKNGVEFETENGKKNNLFCEESSFDFTIKELKKAIETLHTPGSHTKTLVIDGEKAICYDTALVRAMEIALQTMEKVEKTM